MTILETRSLPDCRPAPRDTEDTLKRLGDIQREIARATQRINYLKLNAERANSRLTPVSYGRGYEHSRVEYAVLESDAERWGIGELQRERDELLLVVRPLVEALPAGLIRAVATQRYLDGIPCGIIGKRMHYSRCYIYRILDAATARLCRMGDGRTGTGNERTIGGFTPYNP